MCVQYDFDQQCRWSSSVFHPGRLHRCWWLRYYFFLVNKQITDISSHPAKTNHALRLFSIPRSPALACTSEWDNLYTTLVIFHPCHDFDASPLFPASPRYPDSPSKSNNFSMSALRRRSQCIFMYIHFLGYPLFPLLLVNILWVI